MDLTRLYNLTTPELREQAERLGVRDTYAMSRGQLIQAIRDKSAPPRPESFIGKVFGFARWAIQAAGETREASASDPEPAPKPQPAPKPEPKPASALAPEPASASGSAPEPASPPTPVETETAGSKPPVGVFSDSASLLEEPFPTRTMARILADQGHYKRSLAIYGRLLSEEPGDGELVAEAEAVRAQARARRSHAPQ